MMILKWFCFVLLCLDTIRYIIDTSKRGNDLSALIGLCFGVAARVYALYGTAAYWLFA